MVKREYRGPPIDGREQWITERPNMTGTPPEDEDDEDEYWGTSPDDLFDESWEIVPSYIEQDALTEVQENIVQWYFSLKQSRVDSVANYVDWSESKIAAFLYQLLDEGDFSLGPENDEWINESESRQIALDAYLTSENPESVSFYKLGDEREGTSGETVKRVVHRVFKDSRTFDELGRGSQLAIRLWAHYGLESSLTELQREYDDIPKRYFGEAKRIYHDLIQEQEPESLEAIEDDIEEYKESKGTPTKSEASSVAKPREEKSYSGLTDNQQTIVDEIAESPGTVGTKIADRLGKNPPQVYNLVKKYPHIVKQRIEEVGAVESVEDVDENTLEKTDHLGEWNFGEDTQGDEREHVLEREIEEELEQEFDVEQEIPQFGNLQSRRKSVEKPFLRVQEETVFLRGEVAQNARAHVERSAEYTSLDDLVADVIKKELNGEYEAPDKPASDTVRTDMVAAIIELAGGDPEKAEAIRTLIG